MWGFSGGERQSIAVIGSGIAGLGAAWLLARRHRVTVYEAAPRPGGHSNTVFVPGARGPVPVDTGFIVYNEQTYPNLTALFRHLGVVTKPSDMSFAVSIDDGGLEYAGTDLGGLFAQRRNLLRPRFWSMLRDLRRFYLAAPRDPDLGAETIGSYLDRNGYGAAFQADHLLPMAAAIWSGSTLRLRDFPIHSFIRFCDNHGLLQFRDRPVWRTVEGGSRRYVRAMIRDLGEAMLLGRPAVAIRRLAGGAVVRDVSGESRAFDAVVVATHADQALGLLEDPSRDETALLGAIPYARNRAVLHTDPAGMPGRRRVWSSWNYVGRRNDPDRAIVTYWMNRLQGLPAETPLFVTLSTDAHAWQPRPGSMLHTEQYDHPQFNLAAMAAQRRLWSLQGQRQTWFCGAYFGAGFHEDGLQSGLAVAEQLGGVRRPWHVPDESGRIHLAPVRVAVPA
jgi:predicted NAD/FAD-binding protein